MMTPRISIIIPVYNVEKYLSRCIESILAQTLTDWELILVDDGSPDNSGAICDAYSSGDSRIKVFHNKNCGANAARRYGALQALGEWIMFVDGDDVVTPTCLELLLVHKDKGDIIEGTFIINNGTFFKQEVCGKLDSRQYIEALLLNKASIGPFAKLYKKSVIPFDKWKEHRDITNNEDLLMLLTIAGNVHSVFVDPSIVCYNYLFREGSAVSNIPPKEMWWKLFGLIQEMIKPIFGKVPPAFYSYVLFTLDLIWILRGQWVDKKDPFIVELLEECRKIKFTYKEKYTIKLIEHKYLQYYVYRKNIFKNQIKKLIHYK